MIALMMAATLHSTTIELKAAQIPKQEQAFAKCVSWQESRNNYHAIGDNQFARGRWQFLDNNWRHGLSFMVADRLVTFGLPKSKAKILIKDLQKRPIDTWKPIYQDIGFVSALNAKGSWSGWRHWAVDSQCVKLVPLNKR